MDIAESIHIPHGTISEVVPIREHRSHIFKTRTEISKYVEIPLRAACEEFYDKNILTLSSSANVDNLNSQEGDLLLDWDSLSSQNKKIVDSLGFPHTEFDKAAVVSIPIPLSPYSTVEEISKMSQSIAHQFKKQPMTWVPTYNYEYLCRQAGVDPKNSSYTIEDFITFFKYYYDPKSQLFYLSKEHYEKAQETVDEEE